MKEIVGNIFTVEADAICVPTNGIVKANGELTMGKGLALQFAENFPMILSNGWEKGSLAQELGKRVKSLGNIPHLIQHDEWTDCDYYQWNIISFPTKNRWQDPSSIKLIECSTISLVKLVNDNKFTNVVLPRVGCGLGQLNWSQVKIVLETYLDDRFSVITPK